MKIKLKESKYGNYQFCKRDDLINLWINQYYKDKVVVVLYDSYKAFESIPFLNILKRDRLPVYLEGIQSEYTFVEFETPEKACDFVFGFEYKTELKWVIYNNGKLHMRSK